MAPNTPNADLADFKKLINVCIDHDEISDFGIKQLEIYIQLFCQTYEVEIEACRQFFVHVVGRVPQAALKVFITNFIEIVDTISITHQVLSDNLWDFVHKLLYHRTDISKEDRSWVMMLVLKKRQLCRLAIAGDDDEPLSVLPDDSDSEDRDCQQSTGESIKDSDSNHQDAGKESSASTSGESTPSTVVTQTSGQSRESCVKNGRIVKLRSKTKKKVVPKETKSKDAALPRHISEFLTKRSDTLPV